MTEAGWTRKKPTAAGWYWWRNLSTDNAPEVWAIVDHGDGLEVVGPFDETALDEWVADMDGEWLGPITPTDDAALRRAKAEVWKEAALYVTELIVKPVGILDADTIFAIQDLLDARAAQIEEGE